MFRSLATSFKRFFQPTKRRPYRKPQRTQLTLEALESREMLDGALSATLTAVGADAGAAPRVQVHNADGSLRYDFLAYDSAFTGGVHVAVGDVNGDGMQDIITGTGAGAGPHVRVFDGVTGQVMRDFFAYSPLFTGGITVASADVNNDGFDDIITGAGPSGGPHVQVFSGRDGSNLASFFAYNPSFTLGINIAAGDVNGDGFADIITAPQTGGGPHVKVFSGQNSSEMANFFAYNPSFTGGVYVAAGDVNGDGFADIVTGTGANGGPHVKVYSGAGITNAGEPETLRDFFAYAPTFLPGVRVATTDHNNDGYADILTGAGPGGGPHVKVFDGATNNELDSFFAFESSFTGGLFVGGKPNNAGGDTLSVSEPTGDQVLSLNDILRILQLLTASDASANAYVAGDVHVASAATGAEANMVSAARGVTSNGRNVVRETTIAGVLIRLKKGTSNAWWISYSTRPSPNSFLTDGAYKTSAQAQNRVQQLLEGHVRARHNGSKLAVIEVEAPKGQAAKPKDSLQAFWGKVVEALNSVESKLVNWSNGVQNWASSFRDWATRTRAYQIYNQVSNVVGQVRQTFADVRNHVRGTVTPGLSRALGKIVRNEAYHYRNDFHRIAGNSEALRPIRNTGDGLFRFMNSVADAMDNWANAMDRATP